MSLDPTTFLATRFADPDTGWSLGTFGAVATFTRAPAEPALLANDARALSVVTGRGGIRLDRCADVRLVASETALEDSWNHRIAICLPSQACRMSGRMVVTEIGPDSEALRPQERTATLFDLGLGARQVDIFLRAADARVAERLRAYVGRSAFESDGSVLEAMLRTNAHQVFVSRTGRAEVYTTAPEADGATLARPRVHVLPKLLALRRTHAATEPIPAGLVPFAYCHPPHPGRDADGRARPFDHACHAAFQSALRAFGDPQLNALKQAVVTAVTTGLGPDGVSIPKNRYAFGCARVALRQLQASGVLFATLDDWIAVYFRRSQLRRR